MPGHPGHVAGVARQIGGRQNQIIASIVGAALLSGCGASVVAGAPQASPPIAWSARTSSVPTIGGGSAVLKAGRGRVKGDVLSTCWRVTELAESGTEISYTQWCGGSEGATVPDSASRMSGIVVVTSGCAMSVTVSYSDSRVTVPAIDGAFLVPLTFAPSTAGTVSYTCGDDGPIIETPIA